MRSMRLTVACGVIVAMAAAAVAGPPAGDECEDCLPVTEGDFSGTTFDNTDMTGDDSSCSLFDTFDEWYCYTASCSGMATATTCDAANFDTSLSVFASCGGTEIICNDDFPGCAIDTAQVSWPVVAGTTYYIRIAGFFFLQGDFILTISCNGCPGTGGCFEDNGTPGCNVTDCCLAVCAIDSACCDTVWDQACVDRAVNECVQCPNEGGCFFNNGTPGCDDLNCCLAVCDSDPFCCDILWDSSCVTTALTECANPACPGVGSCFAVQATPACEDPLCCNIICIDDAFCCDTEWDASCVTQAEAVCEQPPDCGVPGTGDCFTANGSAYCESESCCDEVCGVMVQCCVVEWDAACVSQAEALCRPANDDCDDAIMIGVGDTPFDTIDGSTDGDPLDSFCDMGAFGDEQIYNDIWYQYVAPCSGDLTVSTCDSADFDTRIAVYSAGSCPADAELVLVCNDDGDDCADPGSLVTLPIVKDEVYTIRLGGFGPGDTGSGMLKLIEARAEPPLLTLRSIIPPGGLGVGDQFEIWVVMSQICPELASGFQAYVEFNPSEMVFISGEYPEDPFGSPGIFPITAVGAEIDLAATIDAFGGQLPTADDSVVAILTMEMLITDCSPTIEFRKHEPPTLVMDDMGDDLLLLELTSFPPERGPGDVDFNGEVDVLDLVELIMDFGLCPPVPEYCNADLDCNGDVNVLDLVQVIVNWTDFDG